jgi:hypothetical protein
MSDETNVLDFLREQFARVHARFDRIATRLDEVVTQLGQVQRRLELADAP